MTQERVRAATWATALRRERRLPAHGRGYAGERDSNGTRPVIFKRERLDYKGVYVSGTSAREKVTAALERLD